MKIINFILASALLSFTACVYAGDADALIELDKQWGSAAGADGIGDFVSQDIIVVSPDGISGIEEMMAAQADAAPATDAPYVADDYQVRFLSDDIAVMVHTAEGEVPHASMHVYQKQGDSWLVVATASAPKGQ